MNPKSLTEDRAATFKQAGRVHGSFLAAAEKRALIWMAGRMPAWVNSDHLTLLGFVAQITTGVCYALAAYDRRMLLAAIVCLVLNSLVRLAKFNASNGAVSIVGNLLLMRLMVGNLSSTTWFLMSRRSLFVRW
jgi:hypothetical protein